MHTAKILTYNGRKVKIDKDIAPLLSKMWKLGIKTSNSCQGQCATFCQHKQKIITYKDKSTLYTKIKTKYCNDRIWIVFQSPQD